MSAPLVSKPILALLLFAASTSLVTSLAPDADITDAASELLPDSHERGPGAPLKDPETIDFRRSTAAKPPGLPHESGSVAAFSRSPPAAPRLAHDISTQPHPDSPAIVAAQVPQPPFSYLGRQSQEGHVFIFLQTDEDVLAVSPGDEVNSQWRLEHASELELVFRYVPLGTTTILRIAP